MVNIIIVDIPLLEIEWGTSINTNSRQGRPLDREISLEYKSPVMYEIYTTKGDACVCVSVCKI